MNFYQKQTNFDFKKTPKTIKIFLLLTLIFNLSLAIFPYKQLFYFLGMSLHGIKHFFIWQPLTSLFLIKNHSISFGFIFHLAFNMYLLWMFGTSIIELKGEKKFLIFFFTSAILSSLSALFLMNINATPYIFAGANIPLYILAMAWLILYGNARLLLFLSLPFSAKWLVFGIMGINLLSLLSHGSFIHFFAYLFAAFLSYILSLIMWQTNSPFSSFQKMEKGMIYFFSKKTKIYDFKTGKKITKDEKFINEMLDKISRHGKDSLTRREKRKMQKIQKRNNK